MDTNYFVCTLGQASAQPQSPRPYRSIGELLKYQAKRVGGLPAVGFPLPARNGDLWTSAVLTFQEVDKGVDVMAERMLGSKNIGNHLVARRTVALICSSSIEFLLSWLALIKLGHSVLLIAPQCRPPAVTHLCKTCEAALILHDTGHLELARETAAYASDEGSADLNAQLLPLHDTENPFDLIHGSVETKVEPDMPDDATVAYLHHTSGTSSGMPKPIPQSHRAAIGVLPHLPEEDSKAAFSTTPLYHGGIADLFRSWTSDAMIWLFPGKDIPITARNISLCFEVADKASKASGVPRISYFSSVPYVLQMMEADPECLKRLKTMDIVGVGGAALPAEVGDRLVHEGVNLISRFGSAECGFLLSSHRGYETDSEWQYLRNYNPQKLLNFESRESGLFELVIKPGWPHMAKTNRPDGSFATADLFLPHPTIENAWLYHSRADSQLTLITGKKFDPAPLESAIAAAAQLDDVLIFGNGRPYPGALLFRSNAKKMSSDADLLEAIKPIMKKLNRESQDHARIPDSMLIPMPFQEEGLEKSSKGTLIRRAAEERYAAAIEKAYNNVDGSAAEDVMDEDIANRIMEMIKSAVSKDTPLSDDTDLFSYGVDSVACMQLRSRLRKLIPNSQHELPLSIVEDCGTARRLSDYIIRRRQGAEFEDVDDDKQIMLDLVDQYGSFKLKDVETMNGASKRAKILDTVVLTGATGALGAHILNLLRSADHVGRIYCLVRGADEKAATERVSKALEERGLGGLYEKTDANNKIKVLQTRLSDPQLGLSKTMYEELASEAELIIHVAWTVNFRLKLRSFVKDNIAGVRHLIDLATKADRPTPPRFAFCSSTASMLGPEASSFGEEGIPENIIHNPTHSSPLGYSRSKWVAEEICFNANRDTRLHDRVAVMRVGQLAGDSKNGIWNTQEAWPMMLSTVKLSKCLPDLGEEPLDWLPVDIAAEAFLQAANHLGTSKGRMHVYHILNQNRKPTWNEMLQWLRKKEDFEIVSADSWVRDLEKYQDTDHPALKLLGLWKEAYCNVTSENGPRPRFAMHYTREAAPILKDFKPLDEAYFGKVWDWVQEHIHTRRA